MSVMIEARQLGRNFGQFKAVDGVTFSVNRGEVLGFLGPNGAGKSTTMKMLTCFLAPSFGTARIAGFDVTTNPLEARRSVGYLPENAPLYGEMEVGAFLGFVASMRGIDGAEQSRAVARVQELTGLNAVMRQRIETLSKGFKRRVGLAQAIIHDPEILILDEPTDGLDPNQKSDVRSLIRSMAETKSILLSTHILEEVDEVCHRAVIIDRGKLVADSTPDELRKRSKFHGAVTVCFEQTDCGDMPERLASIAGVKEVVEKVGVDDHSTYLLLPKERAVLLNEVVRAAEKENWKLRDLTLNKGQLDEVFRDITFSSHLS